MMHSRLGDILVDMGAVDPQQLEAALLHQERWHMSLGRAVVEKRFCTAEQVLQALATQTGLEPIDLDRERLDLSLAAVVPLKVAQQHRLVPVRWAGVRGEELVVAIAAPALGVSLDAVRAGAGRHRIRAYLASDGAVERALVRLYGPQSNSAMPVSLGMTQPMHFDEVAKALQLEPLPKPRPVLLYGWPESASTSMQMLLAAEGIETRVIGAIELSQCAVPEDVLLAPLQMFEVAVAATGAKFPGRLIVASPDPAEMLERARHLGARSILSSPIELKLLLRAIRRCLPETHPAAQGSDA